MEFRNRSAAKNATRRAFLASLLALAACTEDIRLINDREGVAPPRGTPSPEFPDGLTVGHRLMDAGEFELALKAYTRAAGETGFTIDVLSAIGSANLRLGRLGQAETILRAALTRDDGFVPALNNLGVVLNAKNELGEARELFRAAFALDNGNSTEIRDNLRLVEKKMQNIEPDAPEESDFRLVRRGNGQYSLLGN